MICDAVRAMRAETPRGTINFNSNASIPDSIDRLTEAGIDSIRVSMNSAREEVYNTYYRPQGYKFADVIESIHRAKRNGLFTMLNYLVFPGVTDQRDEVEALVALVESAGIDMIQMRNLSLDPVMYWDAMQQQGEGIGLKTMLDELKQRVPRLQFGYFNRTRDNFYPDGYETDWPIK
jgi:molybdenum cofactor biosynthesis enzyme MoaA